MRIYKTKNYDEMSRKAANIISAEIILNPKANLGLATGSSPIGTYKKLIEFYNNGDLDFSKISSFNLDEYKGLSHDNDQSYFYFMKENLFKHINISMENVHIPSGMVSNAEEECKRYDILVAECGGIDLQLLGIGHNGHIGFNEPDEVFSKGTQVVSLAKTTIDANARFFETKEDVPTKALTMGIKTIMSAKKILLIACGKDKAEILYKTCFGPITPKVPASILQLHPNVTIVADEEALSLFENI